MELTLTEAEAADLADLLDGSLGDLSSEIADTDNPSYRVALKERRDRLRSVRERQARPPPARRRADAGPWPSTGPVRPRPMRASRSSGAPMACRAPASPSTSSASSAAAGPVLRLARVDRGVEQERLATVAGRAPRRGGRRPARTAGTMTGTSVPGMMRSRPGRRAGAAGARGAGGPAWSTTGWTTSTAAGSRRRSPRRYAAGRR